MNSCQANAAACAGIAFGAPPFCGFSSFGICEVMLIGTGAWAIAANEPMMRAATETARHALRGICFSPCDADDATFECFQARAVLSISDSTVFNRWTVV